MNVLDEPCNNPKCEERLNSGTGVRFVFRGMEYAFCSVPCAETKAHHIRGDTEHAIQEIERAKLVSAGFIHVFQSCLSQQIAA